MAIKKQSVGIRLERDLKNKLEKLAKHNNRTLSDYIRIELENLCNKEQSREVLSKME